MALTPKVYLFTNSYMCHPETCCHNHHDLYSIHSQLRLDYEYELATVNSISEAKQYCNKHNYALEKVTNYSPFRTETIIMATEISTTSTTNFNLAAEVTERHTDEAINAVIDTAVKYFGNVTFTTDSADTETKFTPIFDYEQREAMPHQLTLKINGTDFVISGVFAYNGHLVLCVNGSLGSFTLDESTPIIRIASDFEIFPLQRVDLIRSNVPPQLVATLPAAALLNN